MTTNRHKRGEFKTLVRICDLVDDTRYYASDVSECRDSTDKSGYLTAVKQQEVITMGKIVFDPISTPSVSDLMQCVDQLNSVVKDVLPQIGGIVLQDYAALNEGMILARRILQPPAQPAATKG